MLQADNKVRQMMWPLLRADFQLVETYKVQLAHHSFVSAKARMAVALNASQSKQATYQVQQAHTAGNCHHKAGTSRHVM